MEQPSVWESVLIGVLVLLVLLWFRPGFKQAMRQSREAENKDWRGVLLPIGAVILFVILVIMMAASG